VSGISRGISCIAFALVDGQSNPVNNHEWPRLITFFKMDDGIGPSSLNDFEESVTMNYYEKVPERGQFPWQQNLGARPHQLRSYEREVRIAIQHAL
jgi:hypothetical protein